MTVIGPVKDNFNGLQRANNIDTLLILSNKIDNIDALTEIKINILYIIDNKISDISPLTKVETLKRLTLLGSNVKNLNILDKNKIEIETDIVIEE